MYNFDFKNDWLNAVKSNEIVLLLFDISNFDSFQWIVDRAHLIHQLKKIPPSVILIGTKYDLDWKRDVEAEDAYQLAEHFKWQYVEISAADQSISDHVSPISFNIEYRAFGHVRTYHRSS